ncbi:hypothetical protein H7K45_27985 [Mycobacterium yunnanensis]|uniref:Uncharacterized protein n=1 Tax=Mycobacterium yunnanensis TaxID=368477 RepID=A0A9X2YRQ7_9MYCO|nr:hypothetical protein [Mycobacterium yunnanensis]MCV7424392.1 hypothetical protein [Mycobacterium yunnanensis]
MVDAHTIATFAFAQMRRDPGFGPRFPWVRNTVVCVESDLVDDVLVGQFAHYFPEGGTVACYYPQDQRFMFIQVGAPQSPGTARGAPHPDTLHAHDKQRKLTMGMVIDSIYRDRDGDYAHLPRFTSAQIGEASTVEVEKTLLFT